MKEKKGKQSEEGGKRGKKVETVIGDAAYERRSEHRFEIKTKQSDFRKPIKRKEKKKPIRCGL